MLLDDNKNLLFGKLVGLINGLYDEEDVMEEIHNDILDSLKALKTSNNVDEMVNKLVEDKKKHLPNCLVCASPCGRTNDYYINDEIEEDRNDKINRLNKLLDIYETLEYRQLQKEIIKITF
jgi:hypothetical protein